MIVCDGEFPSFDSTQKVPGNRALVRRIRRRKLLQAMRLLQGNPPDPKGAIFELRRALTY